MKDWITFLLLLVLFNNVHAAESSFSEKLRLCAVSLHEPDLGREVDIEAFNHWEFSQDEYTGYLTDLSMVHGALEETIKCLPEELLRPLRAPDIQRQKALDADLNYFAQPVGSPARMPTEAATGYASYVRSLKDTPHRLVAHFYVLYFSMMSGGMRIAEKAAEQFLLPPEALNAYDFSVETHEVKAQLRQSFDQLDLTTEQEKEVLDEVGVAFIRLTSLLKRLDHSSYSLFIAIWIPVELSQSLASLSSPELPRTVWYPSQSYHINLRYIKRINLTQPGGFRSVLAAYRAMNDIRFSPFALSLSGLHKVTDPNDDRENKYRGWLCMNVDTCEELRDLRRQIDDSLSAVGFEYDKKPFEPHITLAHLKGVPAQLFDEYLQNRTEINIAPFTVRSIDLMLSCHKRVRAIFQIESDWHFGARKVKSDPDLLVKRIFCVGEE
jgi:RNA 2',3'-cyclic 3'-phosphodiesterase